MYKLFFSFDGKKPTILHHKPTHELTHVCVVIRNAEADMTEGEFFSVCLTQPGISLRLTNACRFTCDTPLWYEEHVCKVISKLVNSHVSYRANMTVDIL